MHTSEENGVTNEVIVLESEDFGCWVTFWFSTFTTLFLTIMSLDCHDIVLYMKCNKVQQEACILNCSFT